ncbi:hypothetical protein RLO149_c014750 [Roseobacter litoralis Och 149]|uniref:RiboL-PSP-HEPN domain-containing protein n=2 Tax=Roseobacter litoralis TaxID=42443 RepID=F7ZF41_ROSLO|nr:hypothetical protein RLO149_c014750 [Roseobacter litoralis Och 149]
MDELVDDAQPRIQNVYSSQVVLSASGYVEAAVGVVLAEYGRTRGDIRIARYIGKNVARQNSLNCEKIEKVLRQFDKDWWPTIEAQTNAANIAAVDSLKTLRDQIAHGKNNGTGYSTVKDYYWRAKVFVVDFKSVILGP